MRINCKLIILSMY